MKRFIALLLCLVLLMMGAVACDSAKETEATEDTFYESWKAHYEEEIDKQIDKLPTFTLPTIPDQTEDISEIVYVSKSGKIHRISYCSGMKYYTPMTYNEAIRRGYSRCQNCY